MRGTPHFSCHNPFKEKVEIVGKSGTGKNVLLMELLKS
jgi:ABC-type thiamine transport system ATPase subunit